MENNTVQLIHKTYQDTLQELNLQLPKDITQETLYRLLHTDNHKALLARIYANETTGNEYNARTLSEFIQQHYITYIKHLLRNNHQTNTLQEFETQALTIDILTITPPQKEQQEETQIYQQAIKLQQKRAMNYRKLLLLFHKNYTQLHDKIRDTLNTEKGTELLLTLATEGGNHRLTETYNQIGIITLTNYNKPFLELPTESEFQNFIFQDKTLQKVNWNWKQLLNTSNISTLHYRTREDITKDIEKDIATKWRSYGLPEWKANQILNKPMLQDKATKDPFDNIWLPKVTRAGWFGANNPFWYLENYR